MAGQPYRVGDHIVVNGQERQIEDIAVSQTKRFGQRWVLLAGGEYVTCDDEGKNHKIGSKVVPSQRVGV